MFKMKVKNVFKKVFKIFKYKEKIIIYHHEKKHNYLTRKKIKMLGIVNIVDNVLIDLHDVKYKVVRLSMKEQNGLSEEVEMANAKKITLMSEKVLNKKKYFYVKEKKSNLGNNILYYENMNKNERNDMYREARDERMQEMKYFDDFRNISLLMFLEYKDFDNVISTYSTVFDCDVLGGEELEECLFMLVNEI